MIRLLCALPFAFSLMLHAQDASRSTWLLDSSSLTYRITHPMHKVKGTSNGAKGKGFCQAGMCEFLIAAPVKSFNSGDTNRDLHMIQTVRGAEFPMITVRFRIHEAATVQPTFSVDLEVMFAGQTAHYSQVRFDQSIQGREHRITGNIPTTIKDFGIDPPRFLTIPILNDMPVTLVTDWHVE